jgi:hypothetical protein
METHYEAARAGLQSSIGDVLGIGLADLAAHISYQPG